VEESEFRSVISEHAGNLETAQFAQGGSQTATISQAFVGQSSPNFERI